MRNSYAEAAILRGELPTWVMALTMPDGRVLMFSTAAIDVPSRSSLQPGHRQVLPLLTGISAFDEELDYYSLDGVGALTQANLTVAWHESIAALQGDWMHFSASKVEVFLLWDGQDYEDRFTVLASGTVQGIEFGIAGESTRIMVETTPPKTSATVGDDTRDLGTDWAGAVDTGGTAVSDLTGRKYQRVYGTPASVPGYKVGDDGGITNILVLAGHHFGDLTGVEVFEDGVSIGNLTPVNDTKNGQDYCYVDSNGAFAAANGAYTFKATNGGIAAADGLDRAARGAGDILRKLLQESALEVDWGRMEATFAALAGWDVGFYTDKEATAIDVIRDKLVGTVPIVEMHSGRGIWFAYASPWTAPIVADLVMGQHLLGRVGRMKLSDLETIENSFTVNHTFEAFSGVYEGTELRDADSNTLCYFSKQLYGDRAATVLNSKSMNSTTVAQKYANHRANLRAMPRREVVYLVAQDLYWLRAGMVVTLTDPDQGITKVRAVARSVARAQSPYYIAFTLVDRTPVSRL